MFLPGRHADDIHVPKPASLLARAAHLGHRRFRRRSQDSNAQSQPRQFTRPDRVGWGAGRPWRDQRGPRANSESSSHGSRSPRGVDDFLVLLDTGLTSRGYTTTAVRLKSPILRFDAAASCAWITPLLLDASLKLLFTAHPFRLFPLFVSLSPSALFGGLLGRIWGYGVGAGLFRDRHGDS